MNQKKIEIMQLKIIRHKLVLLTKSFEESDWDSEKDKQLYSLIKELRDFRKIKKVSKNVKK